MPRSWGVSACSTACRMWRKPKACTVALCRTEYPSGLRTNVMRSVFVVEGFALLGIGIGHLSRPEGHQFLCFLAPISRFFICLLECVERLERGIHHVQHIRAPKRLGQDVADADRFQHRAHTAAGNDARAGRSRFEQHLSATIMLRDFMRDSRPR